MAASPLDGYQQRIATALRGVPTEGADPRGADVARWSVQHWAAALLRNVCPLTGTLLVLRGRYAADVAAHLERGHRPVSLHAWGRDLLTVLADDADPTVADVARLEHDLTAPEHERRPLPEPWIWRRDPWLVATALAQGLDPDQVPEAEAPILVYRETTGRLATAFAD